MNGSSGSGLSWTMKAAIPMNEGMPISQDRLQALLTQGIQALGRVNPGQRPRGKDGQPGGLVILPQDIPCLVIPDLHARPQMLQALLASRLDERGSATIEDLLEEARLSLLFLGDIPHAEGQAAARRWMHAYERLARERVEQAILCPEMEEEMQLALEALRLVIELQSRHPGRVFCLKGNHDNMTNAGDHGDHPFYKYAMEGMMGALWLRLAYGEELFPLIRAYERALPVLAAGPRFFASHAEPAWALSLEDILDYHERPEVVEALIWTANDEAAPGSVRKTMEALSASGICPPAIVWLSGHRPVAGHFARRAEGLLMQIHNPSFAQAVLVPPHERPAKALFVLVPENCGTLQRAEEVILDPSACCR